MRFSELFVFESLHEIIKTEKNNKINMDVFRIVVFFKRLIYFKGIAKCFLVFIKCVGKFPADNFRGERPDLRF